MKPKPEMIEGEQAFKNFENGMKKLFRVPKSEVDRLEKQYKDNRGKTRKKK